MGDRRVKILITGGAGLVGTAIVRALQQMPEHKFLVVDNLLYESDYLLNVPFKGGDISDPAFLIRVLTEFKPDAVIHLAGIVGDGACAVRPYEAYRINLDSVRTLCNMYDGRIIFPSSCSVYGVNNDLVTEEAELSPLSLYASLKSNAERVLEGKNVFIPRLGTLHGVSGRLRNDLVVNILTLRALTTQKIRVFGGEQYRPLLHVKDAVDTFIYQCTAEHTGIFNLVEGNYRIFDIAEKVQEMIPGTEMEVVETSFEDSRNYKASSEKAYKAWGFAPRFQIHDTINDLIQVYNENRVKDFSNMKYSNLVSLQLNGK